MKRGSHPSVLTLTSQPVRKAVTPEEASHVLGIEVAEKLAEMQENAMRILTKECAECGKIPDPNEKFKYGAVVRVFGKNRINGDDIYIVPYEELYYLKETNIKVDDKVNKFLKF